MCWCVTVCGVWGDSPTALSGGDSCHQLTEGDTHTSLFYSSHHLEREGDLKRVESSVPQLLPLTLVNAMYVQCQCSGCQFVPSVGDVSTNEGYTLQRHLGDAIVHSSQVS